MVLLQPLLQPVAQPLENFIRTDPRIDHQVSLRVALRLVEVTLADDAVVLRALELHAVEQRVEPAGSGLLIDIEDDHELRPVLVQGDLPDAEDVIDGQAACCAVMAPCDWRNWIRWSSAVSSAGTLAVASRAKVGNAGFTPGSRSVTKSSSSLI